MKGLFPKVEKVLTDLVRLSVTRDYTLIGGTALSIQINHRLSEDIDLCTWKKTNEPLPTPYILKELKTVFTRPEIILQNPQQNDFLIDNVKVTFFNDSLNETPGYIQKQEFKGLSVADIYALAGMKATLGFNRAKFRDYYDIFCIAKDHLDLDKILASAIEFKPYLNTRLISEMLTANNPCQDEDISLLKPRYQVSVDSIRSFFIQLLNGYRSGIKPDDIIKKLNISAGDENS